MILLKGKHSGFCFGVKRAVEEAFSLSGEGNFVLGEIIHNESVNEKLKSAGVITVTNLDDERLKNGDTLLIRTHGEPKSTFIKAENMGLNVIDCTCPFVKEIQKIVEKHHSDGYTIVIVGDKDHPEVIGINGWCENCANIVNSLDELNAVQGEKLCVVVQTTYSEEKFDYLIKNFNQDGAKTVDIFKTICYTTCKRQREAEYLSGICDAVLVLGGANSNNTKKLFDVCRSNCKNVYRVINPQDFDYEKLKNYKKVGVVFGASTPFEQFREVILNMENITEENVTVQDVVAENVESKEENTEVAVQAVNDEEQVATESQEPANKSEFETAVGKIRPSKDFRIGQIVTASISSANDDGITISLDNIKADFELNKSEMLSEYSKEEYKEKIGTKIRVMVVGKGPLKFSEKAMEKVLKEEADVEEIRNGKLFEAMITAVNKGGLTGKYGSYEVFVPASQIKLGFVKDMEKYVGKPMTLKAEKVESHGKRRQIVGSRKVILEAEKAERDAVKAAKEKEFFDNVTEGDIVLGTPVRFTSFGAFVEVNGFDCLAHISDLSWTGCSQCSDVLELNKEYEFKVLKLDAENKKVSIGYKQMLPRPWDLFVEKYKVDDTITGKVVRIVNFGAFVEIEKGVDGLVHVSQISNEWLENPVTALQVGQEVTAKILNIDYEKEKVNLSIKALLPEVESPVVEEKKAKGKKGAAKDVADNEAELKEWKDDSSDVSIADILNGKN